MNMSTAIKLGAVIIPTKGRDECLRQTLRDLDNQSSRNFEIWVVDQNQPPLANLAKDASTIRLLHEKTEPLGSHAGRNHAIFKTQAEVCIFIDDDVRLDCDFVKKHLDAYADSSVSVVAGRVIQPKDGYDESAMTRLGEPARYNALLGKISGNFIGPNPASVQHIHECNFSARTDLLRQVGGFNEEFKGNAYFEGADLGLSFLEAGARIEYRPEISLVHLQEGAGGNREKDRARYTYWYFRNYGLLNSLHMNRLGLPAFTAYSVAYIAAKAAKHRDLSIAGEGAKGLLEGLRYFLPGSRRRSRHNQG